MGVQKVSWGGFRSLGASFSSPQGKFYLVFLAFPNVLFSLLSFFSRICVYFHPLFSLLSALVSLLSARVSLRASLWSIQRRGGFRVANWDPPPPAWHGSRACEIGVRFHQSLSSEGHRAFRQSRRAGASPLPKMPSSSLRGTPKCRPGASDGLQIAKLCKCLQKSTKFSKRMLNSANFC